MRPPPAHTSITFINLPGCAALSQPSLQRVTVRARPAGRGRALLLRVAERRPARVLTRCAHPSAGWWTSVLSHVRPSWAVALSVCSVRTWVLRLSSDTWRRDR